jgi:hypothetical protein
VFPARVPARVRDLDATPVGGVAPERVGPAEGWRQMRKLTTIIGLVLILALSLVATLGRSLPARAATGDSVVLDWNQRVLDAVVATKTGPTIAARALAVVHTAIYDAWAAYDPVAVDSRGRLRANADLRQPAAERTLDNKTKAVSFAAYATLVDLFPGQEQQDAFAVQMRKLGYAIDGTDTSPAAEVGAAAAQAVLAFRHQDGANQLNNYADYTGYKSATNWNDPLDRTNIDHWQPLCVLTDGGSTTACRPRRQLGTTARRRTTRSSGS